MVIDFHTHAFPDSLAPKAMAALMAEIENPLTFHDGRLSSLIGSMDRAGIDKAVVCSIATKPSQFVPIFEWSKSIASERIFPFPSIHPDDTGLKDKIESIADSGLKGIKLHPYYQKFVIDDERMFPIYERASSLGLVILCHTGFDIAFPRERIADPARVRRVSELFPRLRLVAAHLGGWQDWEEVKAQIVGRNIYIDTSLSLEYAGDNVSRFILSNHPADYLLFGTDSPWADQGEAISRIKASGLGTGLEEKLFFKNAEALLGLDRPIIAALR